MEGMSIPQESASEAGISRYVDNLASYRHRVSKLWKDAQTGLIGAKVGKGLRQRLGLVDGLDASRTRSGPARLYGVVGSKRVERCFQPTAGHTLQQSRHRVFKGAGWHDVVVVPYFQNPGRISAFMFVGRQCSTEDQVFKPLRLSAKCSQSGSDSGLAGLDGLLPEQGHVIAMGNPLLMLRLQTRHFNTSLIPMPLVTWHPDTRNWQSLNGKRLVFWTALPTPELLIQLDDTDAELAVFGPTTKNQRKLSGWLRHFQTVDFERRTLEQAMPWREAIKGWMRKASDTVINRLTSSAAQHSDRAAELLGSCDAARRARAPRLQIKTAVIDGHQYVERNGVLYKKKGVSEQKVLPGCVRISKIVTRESGVEYIGYIKHRRAKIPFKWQDGGLTIQGHLTKIGVENGFHVSTTKKRDWLQVFLAFSNPEVLRGKEAIGWDGERFQFKSFSIKRGAGKIRQHCPDLYPEDAPGPHRPFKIRDEMIPRLSQQGIEAEFFWALSISVLRSVISPSEGLETPATLVSGDRCQSSSEAVFVRLGVQERLLRRVEGPRSWVGELKWPHQYPVVVKMGKDVKIHVVRQWLLEQNVGQIVHNIKPLQAYALLCQGGFQVVHCEETIRPSRLAQMPMEMVIPAFLRDVGGHLGEWDTIQKALLEWLGGLGADTTAVEKSSQLVVLDDDEQLLKKTLAQMFLAGVLRAEDARKRSVLVDYDSRGLIVDQDAIRKCFEIVGCNVPDLSDADDPVIIPRKMLTK